MRPQVDETKLNESLQRMLTDIGAAMSASLVVIGDKLGLYKILAAGGPMTPAELAKATGTSERYVHEWLNNQAAGGYVTLHPKNQTYSLTPEQAHLLADETSTYFIPGAFQIIAATVHDAPHIEQRFKTGRGLEWGEHNPGLFEGTERFFGHLYAANLIKNWIPSLQGVEPRLKKGIDVADLGCGHGASTILMAKAYPNSRFVGYDSHEASIKVARERAKASGVEDRVQFKVGRAESLPGTYDFVTTFDALHDMTDPLGVAKHTREMLRPEGEWMIVEPKAGDDVSENLNPIGRLFYGTSTMVCVPSALAGSSRGPTLGAQAGEKKIREVVEQGGFKHVQRVAQTPFNMVLEARP